MMILALTVACGDEVTGDRAARQSIDRIVSTLQPARIVVPQDTELPEERPRYRLQERMQLYGVSELSMAAARRGEVVWARVWTADTDRSTITPEHRFQAADLSTVATTVLALRLIEKGELDLSSDLRRRVVALSGLDHEVTLRHLLQQSSRLQPLDAGGLEASKVIERVSLSGTPGTRVEFSEAAWAVLQYLIAPQDPRGFAARFEQEVISPLSESQDSPVGASFSASAPIDVPVAQLPPGLSDAARSTRPLAARGLWATSEAMLRLVLAVAQPSENGLLGSESLKRVTAEDLFGAGLGFEVGADGEWIGRYGRLGAVVAVPSSGDAVAVLTTGGRGGDLARELILAVAEEFGWAGVEPEILRTRPFEARSAAAVVGSYEIAEVEPSDGDLDAGLLGESLDLSWSGGNLSLDVPAGFFPGEGATSVRLHPVGGGLRMVEYPGMVNLSPDETGTWQLRYRGWTAYKGGAPNTAPSADSAKVLLEGAAVEDEGEADAGRRPRSREPDDEG